MSHQLAPGGDFASQFHLTEEQLCELLDASSATSESRNRSQLSPAARDGDGCQTSASNADPTIALAEAHLLTCERCAAEFASLREALSLFREASIALADNELRHRPPLAIPARTLLRPGFEPMYWVAAAMLLVALFPLQVLRRGAPPPAPAVATSVVDHPVEAQSDEALLEDVSREISASVPTPMQALVDPIAGVSSAGIQTSHQTSAPGKD